MKHYRVDPVSRALTEAGDAVEVIGLGVFPPGDAVSLPELSPAPAGYAWVLGNDDQPVLVEDHRGTVYDTGTAVAVEHTALGPLPGHLTPLPPPERFPQWQGDAWGVDLLAARADAVRRIDAAVDYVTYSLIGVRGAEYQQAESEASAYRAAGYEGVVPRSVEIDVRVDGISAQEAAERILAQATAWRDAQMDLREMRRMAKAALVDADLLALDAIVAGAEADFESVVAPLR